MQNWNFTGKALVSAVLLSGVIIGSASAQYPGWQQSADYAMDIVLDTALHRYNGEMTIAFQNNSPESLDKLYFHLFFNAFQPGSMMDVRSLTIEDPDRRVGDRISYLPEDEWGWQRIESLTVGGKAQSFTEDGTILEVSLDSPVKAGKRVKIGMTWEAQVPRQVRRSGWSNAEGVEYSMTQWFPKLCEFDHDGWHTEPYVGREFHGIWGDFDVRIEVPAGYIIGGTGVLQNDDAASTGRYRFLADQVIDFAWAADPDYLHASVDTLGTTLNFYHQSHPDFDENWRRLPEFTTKAFAFLSELIGPYPYPQYTVIQGGDGGMEYPMATLITGQRSLRSLVGVTVHEMAHSWFQAVLATNESLYEYMDEGMTSYATSLCMAELFASAETGENVSPHRQAFGGYMGHATSGNEEPLVTHADHYILNRSYGVAAYSKGEVLLAQLAAVIGDEARDTGLKNYYRNWQFKHPGPIELKREMERASGIELDWYFQYFINSVAQIDYRVGQVAISKSSDDPSSITLEKLGVMPMPLDVTVHYVDGSEDRFHIPLRMMRGHRPLAQDETLLEDWPWTHPEYTFNFSPRGEVTKIVIDPAKKMADVDRANNDIQFRTDLQQFFEAE